MTELNIWLKNMLVEEYGVTDIKEEWGNLIVNGKTFMIGENTNPYLSYKFSAYYENNGKDRKSFPLGDNYNTDLLRQIMKTLVDWVKKYSNTPRGNLLMKGTVNCYVDNADQATIDSLQMMCNNYGLYNFNFLNCTKKPIQTRVDFERLLMAYSCFHVNKDWCPNTIREYKTARKGEDGSARAPGNDHCLDSVSYSLAPFYSSITMWKTQFKEH